MLLFLISSPFLDQITIAHAVRAFGYLVGQQPPVAMGAINPGRVHRCDMLWLARDYGGDWGVGDGNTQKQKIPPQQPTGF